MTGLRELVGSDVQSDEQPRIYWYPYRSDPMDFNASMALNSDRSILGNQDAYECVWRLDEKKLIDYTESAVPPATSPPADYKTVVTFPK